MQNHGVAHLISIASTNLAAAPGAGSRITVVGLHLSTNGATTVTVGFSAGNQRVYNFTTNQTVDIGDMRWQGDANTALTVQSSAAVTVDATVDFVVETSPS